MRLISPCNTTKTYSTELNAIRAISDLEEKCGENFTVIISTAPNERFSPVLILSEDQLWRAAGLAGNGFIVCRT